MFAAALIVFRESLEAALIIGIMGAATRGLPFRGRWMIAGVFVGFRGAALVASSMEFISNMASGMGQELFNASVLILAVAMLAWHNIWMSVHGRDIAEKALASARSVSNGSSASSVIFLVIALAVLREGSETVLFLYGLATSGDDGLRTTIIGGLSGLAAGSLVGGLLYAGLLRIPLSRFFAVTSTLVLLLAASMASQAARFLTQADILPSLGSPIWNSSELLSQSSALGTVLHGLIGYDSRPSGMQLIFYVTVVLTITAGMRWVSSRGQVNSKA